MAKFTFQSKIDSTDEWCFWTDITFFQTLESAKQHLDEVIRDLIINNESENNLVDPDESKNRPTPQLVS